jgi:uncharacterized delta-60 repeat protein
MRPPGASIRRSANGGIALPGGIAPPTAMIVLSNGDILASSSAGFNLAIARFLPNGSLDPSFGAGGVAVAPFPSSLSSGASGLALAPGGKIVAAGSVTPQSGTEEFAVARFNANGGLDTSFGGTGMVATQVEPTTGAAGQSVVVQPDGKIVVGGAGTLVTYRSETTTGALVRYNANGSLDTTFGNGGSVVGGGLQNISGLGEDASGNVFVLPEFAEFSSLGQRQATFIASPMVATSTGGDDLFLPNGQTIIAQTVGIMKRVTDPQVKRYTLSGAVDTTFNNQPFAYNSKLARDSAGAVAIGPNGHVVVGGTVFFGTAVLGLGRLNTNGSLDSGFGNNGVLTTSIFGNEAIEALAVQPNGDIVASGYTENNSTGQSFTFLARYLG